MNDRAKELLVKIATVIEREQDLDVADALEALSACIVNVLSNQTDDYSIVQKGIAACSKAMNELLETGWEDWQRGR